MDSKASSKKNEMENMPKMTKTVEVIWRNENKSSRDDYTIKIMEENILKLEFEVSKLKDEIALKAEKKPLENKSMSPI